MIILELSVHNIKVDFIQCAVLDTRLGLAFLRAMISVCSMEERVGNGMHGFGQGQDYVLKENSLLPGSPLLLSAGDSPGGQCTPKKCGESLCLGFLKEFHIPGSPPHCSGQQWTHLSTL